MFGAMKAWTCRAAVPTIATPAGISIGNLNDTSAVRHTDFVLWSLLHEVVSKVDIRGHVGSGNGSQIVTGATRQQADNITLVRQLTALVASKQLPCVQDDQTQLQSDDISRRVDESTAAVVGLSALFPSGASSAWMASRLVVCSHDTIIEVPLARWDVNDRSDLSEPAASRVRHYGLVRNAELVDNAAFAVSPAETLAMDPQQRLLLEQGYAALHNAALARKQLDGSLTGVFVGFENRWEFDDILSASPAGGSVYAATGSTASIASGRLSYALGLHGPCVTYDTACSAALAAGHGGLRALQRSECADSLLSAIVLTLAPGVGIAYAIASMTSPLGRSHTFDARADGYARAEACGAVALRLASQACELRVGGSAVRQDGRSASLTAPNGQSQQRLLAAALVDAGTDVDELVLSEAHGTGTALGDPIEARSLLEAVLKRRTVGTLPVGGVKANVGHAETAAGMTGLLKLALGLRQGLAAPNAQLRVLNPQASTTLHNAACALSVQAGRVMRCGAVGVSSFGYSGTIAHAVLQGREDAVTPPTLPRTPPTYKRRAFWWREAPHPFAQRQLASNKEFDLVFHSPVIGVLHTLIADHVVRGQVIFPGAGYLELACAIAPRQGAMAKGVFFLKPLALEVSGPLVEFAASNGEFEVRSGEADGAWEVHCSGALATSGVKWEHVDQVVTRGSATSAATVGALYDGFYSAGLQYGPGYRTLEQAWGADARAMSRLRMRLRWQGTAVHPADLDDALCTISITAVGGGGDDETRLPFAVDDAMLVGGVGELWAVRQRRGFSSLPHTLSVVCVLVFAGGCAVRCRSGVGVAWDAC
jgi:acyl transferase domain-containing protein